MWPSVTSVFYLNVFKLCHCPCYCWTIVRWMETPSTFTYPSTEWTFGWLPLLSSWIMLLWTFLFRFLCERVFISLGYILRSGMAGPYANSMSDLLKNCVFQSARPVLHAHEQRRMICPRPPQRFLLSVFLRITIHVEWYLKGFCFPEDVSIFSHLSLEKYLLKSFAHF